MHRDRQTEDESHYWVTAKLSEPKYDAELTFIQAERKVVDRKLAEKRHPAVSWISVPALGIFHRKDWQKYRRALDHYEKQLEDYADDVEEGVLPVKFSVYNRDKEADSAVNVRVTVTEGRVDIKKKVPQRPERLDAGDKVMPKLAVPKIGRFSRRNVSITGHTVTAEFSALGGHDGAVLVNQLVHIHCGPNTEVAYELRSRNVLHETGDVEL